MLQGLKLFFVIIQYIQLYNVIHGYSLKNNIFMSIHKGNLLFYYFICLFYIP